MFLGLPNLPDDLQMDDAKAKQLRSQQVTDTQPGPLLHDVRVLLDMIQAKPLELSATHRLALKHLREINAKLHQPIDLALQRPQQQSYPPILGLYLLLRASGLTRVNTSGKRHKLEIEPEMHQQWQALNPTEQFGFLLEVWFLRGHADIVGAEYRRLSDGIPDNLNRVLGFYKEIPEGGMPIAENRKNEDRLGYYPDWHNLGLMLEYGMIRVESGKPDPGKGWKIERIYRTDFGDAILSALAAGPLGDVEQVMELSFSNKPLIGVLQLSLQDYLPAWKNNITIDDATAFREGVYTFKVSLEKIWRRIEISAAHSLDALAMIIINSVEFDHDHLYQFIYKDQFGREKQVYHPYMDEYLVTSEIRVGDLPLTVGQSMTFIFDFGDWWEFTVRLEKIDPDRTDDVVRVTKTKGDSPDQYPYAEW